jgi:hypothetical protein
MTKIKTQLFSSSVALTHSPSLLPHLYVRTDIQPCSGHTYPSVQGCAKHVQNAGKTAQRICVARTKLSGRADFPDPVFLSFTPPISIYIYIYIYSFSRITLLRPRMSEYFGRPRGAGLSARPRLALTGPSPAGYVERVDQVLYIHTHVYTCIYIYTRRAGGLSLEAPVFGVSVRLWSSIRLWTVF